MDFLRFEGAQGSTRNLQGFAKKGNPVVLEILMNTYPNFGDSRKLRRGKRSVRVSTFLQDHPDLLNLEEAKLPLFKMLLEEIQPQNRVEESRRLLNERLLEAGKPLLYLDFVKLLSPKKEEQDKLLQRLEKLEKALCRLEYSPMQFNHWLYNIGKDLQEEHSYYDPIDREALPLKVVFPILEGIAQTRSAALKRRLGEELCDLVADKRIFKQWSERLAEDSKRYSTPLAMVFLKFARVEKIQFTTERDFRKIELEIHGYTQEKIKNTSDNELDGLFFEFIEGRRIGRDKIAQTQLLKIMLNLADTYGPYSNHMNRDLFVNVLFESSTAQEFLKNIKHLELLLRMYPENICKEWLSKEALGNPNGILEKQIGTYLELPMEQRGEVLAFYQNFRQPQALLTYKSTMKDNKKVNACFKAFVLQSMEGSFFENRYKLQAGSHLQKVFDESPHLLQGWREGQSLEKIGIEGRQGRLYAVEDTDNPYDLFLIGTEVDGSCQHVSAESSLNKCLMAYVMDGKNRAVLVRDGKTRKIQSRSILRILWDEVEKQPVLLLEKRYGSASAPRESMDWIKELALQRAEKLQLTLVSKHYDDWDARSSRIYSLYPNDLISYGSVAPYEYVESKAVTEGRFVERGNEFYELYRPKIKSGGDKSTHHPSLGPSREDA